MTFENMAQGVIEHYEVWSWAMVVELNQHYNSEDRLFDWDEFIFYSSSTIAIWIYIWIRQNMFRWTRHGFKVMPRWYLITSYEHRVF
jgi:hypothetical protein